MVTLNNYKSLIQSVKDSIGSSSTEELREMLSKVDDSISEIIEPLSNGITIPNEEELISISHELSELQSELLTLLNLPK